MMDIFDKQYMGQNILTIIFIIYLILGNNTPMPVAQMVNTIPGKLIVIICAVILFAYSNPILGVIGLFVAFDLIRRSSAATGIDALKKYAPSEEKKASQFTAFNQFPYTLEQEVVAKMAPIVNSGSSLTQASYKPLLDNLYDASPINA